MNRTSRMTALPLIAAMAAMGGAAMPEAATGYVPRRVPDRADRSPELQEALIVRAKLKRQRKNTKRLREVNDD